MDELDSRLKMSGRTKGAANLETRHPYNGGEVIGGNEVPMDLC